MLTYSSLLNLETRIMMSPEQVEDGLIRSLYNILSRDIACQLLFPNPYRVYLHKGLLKVPVYDYVSEIDLCSGTIIYTSKAKECELPIRAHFDTAGFCLNVGRHLTSTWCIVDEVHIDRLHFLDKTCLYRSYEGVKRYDYAINMFYKGATDHG